MFYTQNIQKKSIKSMYENRNELEDNQEEYLKRNIKISNNIALNAKDLHGLSGDWVNRMNKKVTQLLNE